MTLLELTTRKALYLAAEAAIVGGAQEYRIRDGQIDRWLRRVDLEQVRAELNKIDTQIAALSPTRSGPIYIR